MRCPHCSAGRGRCATTSSGWSITECSSCGRVVEERQTQPHHLFHLRGQDSPLCLVTSDLRHPHITTPSSQGSASVENLRAYLQVIDVASILGLDSDHAFQLFRDCSSATCLRNRSVEALATAALVQAIRDP